MKIILSMILFLLFVVSLSVAEQEEEEPEEITVQLRFKNINVFEYDLDLVFIDQDSNVVWFGYIDADVSACSLYTVEDNEGFPVYTVNKEKIGKQFDVTYIETEVEGEFSGETEQVKILKGLEEVKPE